MHWRRGGRHRRARTCSVWWRRIRARRWHVLRRRHLHWGCCIHWLSVWWHTWWIWHRLHEGRGHISTGWWWCHSMHHVLSMIVRNVDKALFPFFVNRMCDGWRTGWSHAGGLLWRLVLYIWEHVAVALPTVRPDCRDAARLGIFVTLEGVEFILDVNQPQPLFEHYFGTEEWIGSRRRRFFSLRLRRCRSRRGRSTGNRRGRTLRSESICLWIRPERRSIRIQAVSSRCGRGGDSRVRRRSVRLWCWRASLASFEWRDGLDVHASHFAISFSSLSRL